AFFSAVDTQFYSLLASDGPLLGGGTITKTTVSVSPFQAILSWTQNFEVVIPGSGYYLEIAFGPDEATPQIIMNDGDRVIVSVPYISAGNASAFITSINGAIKNSVTPVQGLLTVGIYRGGIFYSNLPRTF